MLSVVFALFAATPIFGFGVPPSSFPQRGQPGLYPQYPAWPVGSGDQSKLPPQGPVGAPETPACTWQEWSGCDKECNGGVQYRTRIITSDCSYGPSHQVATCNTQPCPQDCILSEWSEWGCGSGCCGCSAPCGGGSQSRFRTVISPALFGGACGPTVETQPCNTHECPKDCVVTDSWSTFGPCSVSCGGGYQNRSRPTTFVTSARSGPDHTLANCPTFVEERLCNAQACPIDCVLGEWSEWTPCPLPEFTSFRYRQVALWPQNGGADCAGDLLESQPCGVPGDEPQKIQFPQDPQIPPMPKITPPKIVQPVIPPFVSAPNIKEDASFCQSRPNGGYAKPGCRCCRDFVYCFQRSALTKWCPPGEVWAEEAGRCVNGGAAGCASDEGAKKIDY